MQKGNISRLGAHFSVSGGLFRSVEEAVSVKATTMQIFTANQNTYESVYQDVYPPLIVKSIRIIPTPTAPKPVCLRLELYGCVWEGKTDKSTRKFQIPRRHF